MDASTIELAKLPDRTVVSSFGRRGETFHPPTFDVSEGNIGLSFFAVFYEPVQPLLVAAKLSSEGHLEVVIKPMD